MADRATSVTPSVLRWARERAGLSVSDAAARVGRSADVLISWEDGSDAPTYRQLETLANVFKRPVAVFFFPTPPEEPEPKNEFRTLPQPEIEEWGSDTLLAIREAHAWQQSLRELTDEQNPAPRKITHDIQPSQSVTAANLAMAVREYLGVSLTEQLSWPNPTEAFKQWRSRIESVGVFVFKRSFEQEAISGFCLHDREFPVIMINNSTAYSRQTFTLFHELAHLLFGVNGVTKTEGDFVAQITARDREVEIACNAFAAEFLVPENSFPWALVRQRPLDEIVPELAARYNVSREVILRKLRDRALVDVATYTALTNQWNREYRDRDRGSGGNYYATQAAYLGQNYLRLAFQRYRSGRISLPDLATHLGMKARNVGKLEDFLLARM